MWQKKSETKSSPVTESAASTPSSEAQKTAPPAANGSGTASTAVTSAPPPPPAAAVPAPVAPVVAQLKQTLTATAAEDKTGSRISAGLRIKGEISGTADIWIDGNVEGKVRVAVGRLTVGQSGKVQADVEAREIVVNGTLLGNLKATDRVQIGASGTVRGGVTSPRIGIEDGAQLTGKVETGQAAEEAIPAAKAATASVGATTAKKEGE
jgi:cytoskeletal protein CcmA (bactofilin family)